MLNVDSKACYVEFWEIWFHVMFVKISPLQKNYIQYMTIACSQLCDDVCQIERSYRAYCKYAAIYLLIAGSKFHESMFQGSEFKVTTPELILMWMSCMYNADDMPKFKVIKEELVSMKLTAWCVLNQYWQQVMS